MIDTSDSGLDRPMSAVHSCSTRVLCLGNDLLGDDSLGSRVASRVQQFAPTDVEVFSTSESGFSLLDYLLGTHRLIVIDTVVTGNALPGTIYKICESELKLHAGGSPHYIGLFETIALSRYLRLPVAEEVLILAVEATQCFTVGDEMNPAVSAAIPALVEIVRNRIGARTTHRTRGFVA